MKNAFLLAIIGFSLMSCGGTPEPAKNTTTQTENPPPSAASTPATPTGKVISLPAINQDFAMNIFNNCDYIDIIMYKEGFSMNIAQKPSIQTLVQGLSATNPDLGSNCPAQGRLFFQNQGQTIAEADLHFTANVCAALVFYEKGARAYTSQMTEQGAGIFANYFKNARDLKTQAQQ